MSEFARVANTGINVIIGLGTAVFVLVLFGIILYNLAQNDTTAQTLVNKFFGPIEQHWGTVALLIMLGAAVIVIVPIIGRLRGSFASGGAA